MTTRYKGIFVLFIILRIVLPNAQNIEAPINHPSRLGEFLIDTNFVYIPDDGSQTSPAVASDGTNFFSVWQSDGNIYGSRISTTGNILDLISIPISTASENQFEPSIAFDGTNYLVVWTDYRSGSSFDIYGARVAPNGTILDPDGIPISTLPSNQYWPKVAFGDSVYLIVWQENSQNSDVYGCRMNPSGIVLDPTGIPLTTAPGNQKNPSVSFGDTIFLVVWQDFRSDSTFDIYGCRINTSGVVLDTMGIAISTKPFHQTDPVVDFDGVNHLVVWYDYENLSYDIYGARVNQSGTVIDTGGIAISTAPNSQHRPSVTYNGSNYFVLWEDSRNGQIDIYGCRVDTSGLVLDTMGIAILTTEGYQEYPSIVSNNNVNLVVWEEYNTHTSNDIFGCRVDTSGNVLDPEGIPISLSTSTEKSPAAAFDGTNYLVVWQDNRNPPYYSDIYGSRISATGNILDTLVIPISTATHATHFHAYPSIAFDGANYLIVWEENRIDPGYFDIFGCRVTPQGVVLDTTGIPIATSPGFQYSSSIAFDGTNYLVVWFGDTVSTTGANIYGNRVTPQGAVLDTPGIAISTAPAFQEYPKVVFGGTNYLVVWEDYRNYNTSDMDIYCCRVTPSGAVLDTAGIVVTDAPNNQYYPSVAFNGTNYFIVWGDSRSGSWDIYGARVSQSGTVLDPGGFVISTAVNWQEYPAVCFDDTDYLVVWRDDRNSNWDIYGAKVSTAGMVIDSFAVTTQPGDQISPALVRGSGSQILTVWSGWADSINTNPINTIRTWGKFYPYPGIYENTEYRVHSTGYSLEVYPNPFRTSLVIKYALSIKHYEKNNKVPTINIYDVAGRLLKQFNHLSANKCGGNYQSSIFWVGDDDSGKQLPAGVYFVRLETPELSLSKKIIKLE